MLNRIIRSIFYRVPFLTQKMLGGNGFVFMLHRVLPYSENNYEWNKDLAITPEGIKKWVNFFRSKNFDIVSMDEALLRVKAKKSKKFIAFTLDDGYKDNLEYGLSVFEELNVPCTIYVANCFPNNEAIYWWYFLEDYLKKNDHIDLSSIGILYSKKYSKENAQIIYDEVRELLRIQDYNTHKKFAKEICGITNLDDLNSQLNLTWDQIKTLHEHPLITIGGHTIHHLSLKNQLSNVVEEEVIKGTKELQEKLNTDINHFAFPYGSLDDVSTSNFNVLREMGYKTAVLNHPGSIFENRNKEYFSIPRMGLSDDTSEDRLNNLFCGKVHLDFNGLKKEIL